MAKPSLKDSGFHARVTVLDRASVSVSLRAAPTGTVDLPTTSECAANGSNKVRAASR